MSAEDLDNEEVVDQYEYIINREPFYEEIKEEFVEEIREETNDGSEVRTRIERGIREAKGHDNLLESAISVFLPGGTVHSETGWKFRGAEPLSELNVPSSDLIIGNEDRNLASIIQCKSGLSRPGQALTQLYDAADAVREHKDELEENIGMEFDALECAICVSSTDDIQIAREIEDHKRDGDARERIFIWRLHYLEEGEQLDLFTRIETRSPGDETHDNELAQVLPGGVDITKDEQASPSFFPSSHLYRVMEEVFSTILTRREANGGPLRHFSGEEVLDILTDQRHLPHYDADRGKDVQ